MSTVIFAVDCKLRGESYSRHGLLSVGVAIRHDANPVTKHTWNIAPMPMQGYSVHCWDTYWHGREEQRRKHELNSIEWRTWAHEFRKLVDEWNSKGDLYIIASSHSDVEYINYYLDSVRLPLMQFDHKGQYRHIHDSESYTRGWIHAKPKSQWVNDAEVATKMGFAPIVNDNPHDPASDAQRMMDFHLALIRANVESRDNMIRIGYGH